MKTIKKIREQIIERIVKNVPLFVPNMPYAQSWVLETVANRMELDEPLECSDVEGYEETLSFNVESIEKGMFVHLPLLEKHALAITKDILSETGQFLDSKNNRLKLTEIIRDNI